jgi:DNA polymerase I
MEILTTSHQHLSLLREKVASCKKFGTDIEATSFYPYEDAALSHDLLKVVGVGFGFPDNSKTYIPLAHTDGPYVDSEVMETLVAIFSDPENEVWAHNMKYEIQALRTIGIEIAGPIYCSMLAQYTLSKGLPGKDRHRLKPAVRHYLKHQMLEWSDVVPPDVMAHEIPPLTIAPYCSDDALQCLKLGELWVPEMVKTGTYKAFKHMECEFAKVLAHMRECGMAIDRDSLLDTNEKLKVEETRLASKFRDMVGVDPSKNQQVSKRLFEELRWWPIFDGLKRGGNDVYPINKDIRKFLKKILPKDSKGIEVIDLLEAYSQTAKLRSTYTHTLVERADRSVDGRLRCEFNQTVTATGRLSSSKPNVQNIPSSGPGLELRKAFIAEPGWLLVDADYSQADLRMMAHLSMDPFLMQAYIDGKDLHQQTADACNCSRKTGKVLNLGTIYEMQPETFARNLGISVAEATILWSNWHLTYPRVKEYQEFMHRFVAANGFVKTITGRRRYINNANSKKMGLRLAAFREASNTPDQGSVADILKIASRNLFKDWADRKVLFDYWTGRGSAKIISQVHDEIICEVKDDFVEEAMADIKRHLENAVTLRVPLKADIDNGPNWYEAKPA